MPACREELRPRREDALPAGRRARFDDDQRTQTLAIDTDAVRLDLSLHDPVQQRVTAYQARAGIGR